jgi:four helix bundle protein
MEGAPMNSNGKQTPRVLVIDDDMMVAGLLKEHLTNEGYDVSAVHMAEEGFQVAVQTSPNLIMLDVMLPDATGFQMCSRLRAHPTTRSIPIIVMTGSARWPNQQYWGRRLGANEYILKPFNVIEVGERVRNFVGPAVRIPVSVPSTNGHSPEQHNGNGNGNGNGSQITDFSFAVFSRAPEPAAAPVVEPVKEPVKEVVKEPIIEPPVEPDMAELLSQLSKMATVEAPEPVAPPAPEPAPILKKAKPAATPMPVAEPEQTLDHTALLSQLDKLMGMEKVVDLNKPEIEEEKDAPVWPSSVSEPLSAPIIPLSELVAEKTETEHTPVSGLGEFVVPLSDQESERYVNFSAEIFIMVSRLASTRAEEYVADQLLRSGTLVGAKVRQALSTVSRDSFRHVLSEALQELQATGYWLTLTRKVGLLETLGKKDLETTCQELTEQLKSKLHA